MKPLHVRIVLTLAALALAAWGLIFYQHRQMSRMPMQDMWMPPVADWSALDYGIVFAMWGVMMTAMMLPSALPTLNAFVKICRKNSQPPYFPTLTFVLGYLTLWFAFSALLTILQRQLHGLMWLNPMMDNTNRNLAAGIFLLAGLYQITSIKNICLRYCQSPFGFLLNHWKPGHAGAYRMGNRQGLVCVGCCWAQMLVMFAVGVMNLAGMIALTLLFVFEKISPFEPYRTSRVGTAVFLGYSVYLFVFEIL
ncbi:MAG: DUF2182 domain-containing protein [Gammaproteobacteria bacterium]